MSTTVEFVYRCRKCGKEFTDGATGTKLGIHILIAVIQDQPMPDRLIGLRPNMLTLHTCSDRKSTGVADFIGIYERKD
jgi:hypothetical protein